jgi:hypothetical protein
MRPAKKLNFGNLFFNVVVMLMAAAFFAISPAIAIGASIVSGTVLSFGPASGTVMMAGLQKEIWTDIILEKFYPDGSFLAEGRDMSSLVEFNKINLAEAGADPAVLVNNTAYPINVSTRTDVPKALELSTLDTESTVVRNLEAMELSYDKMASVTRGHKNALLRKAYELGAWNWTPASSTANTPVLTATGDMNAITGYRKLKFEDVLSLETAFDDMDVPEDGRILVLNPKHKADLSLQDMALYKAMMMNGNLFSFKLRKTSVTPKFNATTGVKCAFGAVAAETDTISSFAFYKEEVMKAMGTIEMFYTFRDPANKGDIFNFQLRFVALPMRAKYISAIYSPKE